MDLKIIPDEHGVGDLVLNKTVFPKQDIPDNLAGRVYYKGKWLTIDSWLANLHGPLTVNDEKLIIAVGQQYAYRGTASLGALPGLWAYARATALVSGYSFQFMTSPTFGVVKQSAVLSAGETVVVSGVIPAGATNLYFGNSSALASFAIDAIYVGDGSFIERAPAGEIALDDSLETAVYLSLYTHRGWWGDPDFGSNLHLLAREKFASGIEKTAKAWAEEALAWLVAEGVAKTVEVIAERLAGGIVAVYVEVARVDTDDIEKYSYNWEATKNGVQ